MAARDPRIGLSIWTVGPLAWLAIALTATTGLVHLYLYMVDGFLPFLLGGLGYLGAIVLLLVLPGYRRWLYLVGIPYVLVHLAAGWPRGCHPAAGSSPQRPW